MNLFDFGLVLVSLCMIGFLCLITYKLLEALK